VPGALASSMMKGFNLQVLDEVSPLILLPTLWIPLSVIGCLLWFRYHGGGRPGADNAATAMAAIQNSFYVPFPIAYALTPPQHHTYVAMLVGISVLPVSLLQWTMGVWLVQGDRSKIQVGWRQSLMYALNPPVVGIVGGALLSLVPGVSAAANHEPGSYAPVRMLIGAMDMIGKAMGPLAMLMVGAVIAQGQFRANFSFRLLLPILLFRYVFVPGIVYALLRAGLIPATGLVAFVLLLQAASPPAMNLTLAARRFGGEWEVLSSLMVVANLLALVALPPWLAAGLTLER